MGIAFIGEEDCIQGFRGLGMAVYPVEDAGGAEEILDKLEKEDCAIVFITETYARELLAKIDKISAVSRMNISIIPGIGRKKGIAGERMRRITVRATGMDPAENE